MAAALVIGYNTMPFVNTILPLYNYTLFLIRTSNFSFEAERS